MPQRADTASLIERLTERMINGYPKSNQVIAFRLSIFQVTRACCVAGIAGIACFPVPTQKHPSFRKSYKKGTAMNKITRVLTMSGIGLVAAVMMAGPAQASTASAQPVTKSVASQTDKAQQHRDRVVVAGYFSSRWDCQREGRKGKWIGRWNHYDCDFLRLGLRGGTWRLLVERDWRNNGFSIGNRGHDDRDGHKGQHHSKHKNGGKKGRH
ncbi:hypothetical protein HH310_24090 [Actinoplanes sp. TBRC 11911]|uniref:hypothetical protein n=1 Tax=Actinoplanes sp. TBRC 11911 TaxID=2729386 RepID=UPI00145DBDA5|nr:hypothetical protein [Actinoplanes sp. TBRC 11911]NMO54252.1 hypothetical protein [Actinoplanes sp. TBRC 11911]